MKVIQREACLRICIQAPVFMSCILENKVSKNVQKLSLVEQKICFQMI